MCRGLIAICKTPIILGDHFSDPPFRVTLSRVDFSLHHSRLRIEHRLRTLHQVVLQLPIFNLSSLLPYQPLFSEEVGVSLSQSRRVVVASQIRSGI